MFLSSGSLCHDYFYSSIVNTSDSAIGGLRKMQATCPLDLLYKQSKCRDNYISESGAACWLAALCQTRPLLKDHGETQP